MRVDRYYCSACDTWTVVPLLGVRGLGYCPTCLGEVRRATTDEEEAFWVYGDEEKDES